MSKKPDRHAWTKGIAGAIGAAEKPKVKRVTKASEPEKDIQARAESLCDALGIRWFRIPDTLLGYLKNNQSVPIWARVMIGRYFRGVPDLMLFKRLEPGDNVCRFIEIKTEVGKLSQGQNQWHRGLNVHVTYGWAETEKAIKDFIA